MAQQNWQFWIDVGGTFTDCVAVSPLGEVRTLKVLSSGVVKGQVAAVAGNHQVIDEQLSGWPADFFAGYRLQGNRKGAGEFVVEAFDAMSATLHVQGDGNLQPGDRFELRCDESAPLIAIRRILGIGLMEALPPVTVRLGTTKGTNALLEREGSKVAFVTTAGFGDLPKIGEQQRPDLFDLNIRKPSPLFVESFEVRERIDASGKVLQAIDLAHLKDGLLRLRDSGIEALAICLVNAIWNNGHEEVVAAMAADIGFQQVSVSHRLAPVIKALDRADTAIVDAYLTPVVQSYIRSLGDSLSPANLRLMTSAGGLVPTDKFSGKDSILSGPAGGVVGFATAAREAGFELAIGFDMGGTSTDVSRYDGNYEYQYAAVKDGVRLRTPMFAIETVAAGGGSICRYDGQRLLVGPESAGADPGPACYGNNGPLTITDINFFNGKIDAERFPFRLDREAVIARLQAIAAAIQESEGRQMPIEMIADGFHRIANLKMANAIREISTAKGYDPSAYLLVAFGGAAPQHACAIADLLKIKKVLIHPLAGILSAYGIGMSDIRRFREQTLLRRFDKNLQALLDEQQVQLTADLRSEIIAEGVLPADIQEPVCRVDLRYRGEEAPIEVELGTIADSIAEFEKLHHQLYGYNHKNREVEIVALRVELVASRPKPDLKFDDEDWETGESARRVEIRFGELLSAVCRERSNIAPQETIPGPAMIHDAFSTIIVDPGWTATMTGRGDLLLTRVKEVREESSVAIERDPVRLELFNNHFQQIATRMGTTLQKTSMSVNVKERLDFSCAILDAAGDLVVNAPHIPVHLGAMSESVKGLIAGVPNLRPGDVYLSNDPALGGSHLPDLTVITPVFDSSGQTLRFFAASRAHHAEIGGVRPGSAYPFAGSLAEEGVIFSNFQIVEQGRLLHEDLWQALTGGQYPSRLPEENVADIQAAIAANRVGQLAIGEMTEQFGWPMLAAFMQYLREAVEEKTIRFLAGLQGWPFSYQDQLDDGSLILLNISRQGEKAVFDFSGSAPVNANSLNANPAIVKSAIMYCLRCMIGEDMPLNAGLLAPLEVVIPEGVLNPPYHEDPSMRAAVFAGNVEISQRIVDVVLAAFGKVAASQGTMNNLIFGNNDFGYYETICGGSGAGARYDGADAVHTHMTNTRITDVEIIERHYPVRIRCFTLRSNSGGEGHFRGGNGIVREIEFLADVELSLLTQRRTIAPFGMKGGEAGLVGENWLKRRDEAHFSKLDSLVQLQLQAGDILRICTPGGGGFGPKKM